MSWSRSSTTAESSPSSCTSRRLFIDFLFTSCRFSCGYEPDDLLIIFLLYSVDNQENYTSIDYPYCQTSILGFTLIWDAESRRVVKNQSCPLEADSYACSG
jgi:hypothetical protein